MCELTIEDLFQELKRVDAIHHDSREARWHELIESGKFVWIFDDSKGKIKKDKSKCPEPFLFLKDALSSYIFDFGLSAISTCIFAINLITHELLLKKFGAGAVYEVEAGRPNDEKPLGKMFQTIKDKNGTLKLPQGVIFKLDYLKETRNTFAHPSHKGGGNIFKNSGPKLDILDFFGATLDHLNACYTAITNK